MFVSIKSFFHSHSMIFLPSVGTEHRVALLKFSSLTGITCATKRAKLASHYFNLINSLRRVTFNRRSHKIGLGLRVRQTASNIVLTSTL